MNKQELIEKINEIATETPFPDSKIVDLSEAIELIEQLDEPQKVTVPQFVADWYEEHKDDFETELFQCIYKMPNIFEMNKLSKFEEWLIDEHTKPFQTLVNMHQFGYEVEKEKRYIVKMSATKQPLFYNNMYEKTFFSLGDLATRFTRKQLEGLGLGWVFDCPGIEIEEVEE